MTIGILLALIAALTIQSALSESDNKDASLQKVLVDWIRTQDPFRHVQSKSSSTTSEVVDDISLQMNVVEWVRENGGYFNPKQEFRRAIPGDTSTPFGIFASETIEKGELLVNVPYKCIMTAGTDEWKTYMHCDTTRLIIEEMRKVESGKESFYEPYVKYLLSAPPVNIPSMWTTKGKALLKEIIGQKQLPPKRASLWMTKFWKQECNGSDDPFEIQAAMQLVSRGDDDTLTPVYDMYNHRNGKWLNTKPKMVEDERHEMYASRTILKGQQIYLSYNQCGDCFNRHYDFGTPEMFRDYGFVEQYPQRWVFHNEDIAVDIDQNENTGELQLTWLDENVHKKFGEMYEVTEWGIGVLKSHLRRLNRMYETELKPLEEGTADYTLPEQELESLMTYFHALLTALEMTVEESNNYLVTFDDNDDDDDDDEE